MVNRLLFVVEKYCDADPACGLSSGQHWVVGSIKSTMLARESKCFYFDELSRKLGTTAMSELLIEDCLVFHPDLVIFTPLGGALGDRLNPPVEVLDQIREMGITVYLHLYDAKPACGLETKWLPHVDFLGIVDSVAAYRYYRESPKVLPGFLAASPTVFRNRNLTRDIGVSFLGSIGPAWPMRAKFTSFLRGKGVNITVAGGQRGQRLSTEDYASILNRSRVSLSFCRDGDGRPCLKSKVFEITTCGAMLMEDAGTESALFFELGSDFVAFSSKEELLALVRYYLKHEDERRAIAESGHHKATEVYSARNMWGYLFGRMRFPVPFAEERGYKMLRERMQAL